MERKTNPTTDRRRGFDPALDIRALAIGAGAGALVAVSAAEIVAGLAPGINGA
jgi:hypothetical protein